MIDNDVEGIEIRLFLEALALRYGYDFRDYAKASMRRRLRALVNRTGVSTISHLQALLLKDPELLPTVLATLTVPTSEMFRDPLVYRGLREQVLPMLRTFPSFKVWHAGCSTGEEVYSLAILLREEGLEDRAVIYATDINPTALAVAKEGIYAAATLKQATKNYQKAGGLREFSSYFTAAYGGVRLDPTLRRNVLFTSHNLVTDDVFSEVHLIMCRNVLIYFTRELQNRVVDLFARSLWHRGFLCLGSKETTQFLDAGQSFTELPGNLRIFRKNPVQDRASRAAETAHD